MILWCCLALVWCLGLVGELFAARASLMTTVSWSSVFVDLVSFDDRWWPYVAVLSFGDRDDHPFLGCRVFAHAFIIISNIPVSDEIVRSAYQIRTWVQLSRVPRYLDTKLYVWYAHLLVPFSILIYSISRQINENYDILATSATSRYSEMVQACENKLNLIGTTFRPEVFSNSKFVFWIQLRSVFTRRTHV